jgi:16S rRNA A1518/A1519 N6-dimethyltransferase RsmA/KsgA/DIM1 with predicted DNA glycosylase/AP lyase activity
VLISVLGWLKLKKQRLEREKRAQAINTEYLTYRSYSISNEESNGTKDTAVSNASASNVPNNTQISHDPSQNNNLIHNNIPHNISSSILSNCQHHHMHHSHSHQHPTYISGSVMSTSTSIPS